MQKESRIIFADAGLKRAFDELKTGKAEERRLYDWLCKAFLVLRENTFAGIQVPKRLIPRRYKTQYGATNLWKYNLPGAWRLLYTVKGSEVEVLSIILEWLPHKEYEKRFGYKVR